MLYAAHVLGKPRNEMHSLDLSWNKIRGVHGVQIGAMMDVHTSSRGVNFEGSSFTFSRFHETFMLLVDR
jgi:hypothetical protein